MSHAAQEPGPLPNIYATGLPKACGTSLNMWLKESTKWKVMPHDSTDLITRLTNPDRRAGALRDIHPSPRKGVARTGSMWPHWEDLARDGEALIVMNVRTNLLGWAQSFWRHFRKPVQKTRSRFLRRELGLSGPDNLDMQITLKNGIEVYTHLIEAQLAQSEWIRESDRRCVVALDGSTRIDRFGKWLLDHTSQNPIKQDLSNPWEFPHLRRGHGRIGFPQEIASLVDSYKERWESEILSQAL